MGRILRRRQSSLEDSENRDIDVSKATKKSKTGHSASENLGKQIVNNVKRMALRDKTNALKEVQEPEVSPEKRFPVRKLKNPITVEITKNNSNETKRGVKGDPSQRVKRRGLLEEKETSNAEDVSNNSENVKLVKSDKLPGRPESKLSPGTEVAVLVKKSKRIAARKSLSDEKEVKKWVEQKVITAANSNQTKGNRKRKQPAEGESPEARIAEPTEPKRTAAPKNVAQPIPSVDLSDKDEKCGKSNTSRDSQTTSDDEATSESKSDSERKVVKEKTARNPKRRCQAKENESPVADHESPSGAKKSKRVAARKALVDATIVGGACEVVKANQPNSVCQKDETRNESKDKEMMLKNSSPCVSPIMKTPLSRRSGKPQAVGDVSSPQPLDIEPQPGCSREDVCFKKPKTPSGPKQLSAKTLSPLFSIFKKPDTPRRLSTDNKIFVSGLKESSSAVKHQRPVYDNPSTPLKRRSPLSREKTEELYEFEIDENEPQPKKKHRRIMKIQRKRAAPRKKPKAFVADPEAELRVLRNFDLSPSVLTVQKTVVTNERRVPPPPEDLDTSTAVETRPPEDVVSSTMVQTPRVASSERVAEYSFTPNVVNFDPGPMSSPCGDFGSSTPMYGHEHSLELVRNGLSNKCYSPVISKDSPIPVLLGEYYNDPKRRDNDSDARSNVTVMSGHSYGGDLDVSASTPIKYRHDSTTIVQESKPIDLNLSNCFGFDEPEVVEKPLMSPIKGAAYVPPPVVPPTRAAPFMKKKLPLQCGHPQPAVEVNVNEVIKQLRFEVGNDSTADRSADLSVYDDSEITCNRGRSPIKRFLQPVEKKANVTAETSHDSSSENTPVPAKVPRLSYERPAKLRKQKVVDHFYKDDSESEDSDHADLYFEQEDNDQIKGEKKATLCKKNKRSPVKKDVPKKRERGMTKKEEEELENWAKLFNSQCEQVDSFGLCVE